MSTSLNKKQLHKSTTHEERFVHIREFSSLTMPRLISDKFSGATVFARKENDGKWYASVALCWKVDQFSKEIGRQNARRHYFEAGKLRHPLGENFNYDDAVAVAQQRVVASEQAQEH